MQSLQFVNIESSPKTQDLCLCQPAVNPIAFESGRIHLNPQERNEGLHVIWATKYKGPFCRKCCDVIMCSTTQSHRWRDTSNNSIRNHAVPICQVQQQCLWPFCLSPALGVLSHEHRKHWLMLLKHWFNPIQLDQHGGLSPKQPFQKCVSDNCLILLLPCNSSGWVRASCPVHLDTYNYQQHPYIGRLSYECCSQGHVIPWADLYLNIRIWRG